MQADMVSDRAENNMFKAEVATLMPLKSRVETLEADVGALKLTTDSYMNVRNRFFAVFLRDKARRVCSQEDHIVIENGNIAAHEGDPLVDATMFEKGYSSRRQDFSTFVWYFMD